MVTARMPGHALPALGERVMVSVGGPVVAYPR
jgi:hypothetical protein